MNKGKLTAPFRRFGLMHSVDKWKFYLQKIQHAKNNRAFKRAHSSVQLPPDYMMFESYRLDYHKYFFGGKKSAYWIKERTEKYIDFNQKTILDWGCGPARILRHLPEVINGNCKFYGTDYNKSTIDWCQQHIPNIKFSHNQLSPPLPFSAATFDLIYGISIFTHLSAEKHYQWFEELNRITKRNGIILLTTAGAAFKENMTNSEQRKFDEGLLVTRGKVIEGHRVYAAFQPPSFLRKLFQGTAEVLEFEAGKREEWGINQDLWIIRKN